MKTTTRAAKKVPLNLATLGQLSNGAAGLVIDAAMRSAVRDTEDRGNDKKPRKVTIEIELRKLNDETVSAAVRAKTTLPPYLTEPTIAAIRIDGTDVQAEFNPHAADSPDQMTLGDPTDD